MNLLLPSGGGRIVCADPVLELGHYGLAASLTFGFDCPSASWLGGIVISGNAVLKFQHILFSPVNGVISVTGGGTLIFDDCVLEDIAGIALDIEPTAPFNLVVKNSRISNNTGAVVLLKPGSGGSVTATFNGVTIVNNAAGLQYRHDQRTS
jgi:hypothetical protein